MKIIIYIVFSLIVFSCANSDSQINDESQSVDADTITNNIFTQDTTLVIDEYFNDPVIISYVSNSDTLVISEDCVVFLWPDSLEIEEMKIKYPEDYLTILDDMIFYASEAAISLDKSEIKNFFCDKSVILFKGDKKDIFLKRKKVEGNLILYKYGVKPKISYAIDFNIEDCIHFFTPATVPDSVTL